MKKIIADKELESLRLDRYIRKLFPEVSLNEAYKIIKDGEVLINRKKVKNNYRIQIKDEIILFLKPADKKERKVNKEIKDIDDRILLEDEEILIFNKPSGIPVHLGSNWDYSLEEILKNKFGELYLVHRLDKETSGIMILAKKRSIARELSTEISGHNIKRTYKALVKGRINTKGEILLNIEKDKHKMKIIKDGKSGKQAATTYSRIEIIGNNSLILLNLNTGRTHQIRLHISSIKHPIAGDWKYGDQEYNIQMKKLGLKRMFLHSYQIELSHPLTGKQIKISCEIPKELFTVLNNSKTIKS